MFWFKRLSHNTQFKINVAEEHLIRNLTSHDKLIARLAAALVYVERQLETPLSKSREPSFRKSLRMLLLSSVAQRIIKNHYLLINFQPFSRIVVLWISTPLRIPWSSWRPKSEAKFTSEDLIQWTFCPLIGIFSCKLSSAKAMLLEILSAGLIPDKFAYIHVTYLPDNMLQ